MENKEITTDEIRTLSEDWNQLRLEIINRKKIDYDTFKKVFLNTYRVMEEVIEKEQIDREYLGLILSAHNFANLQVDTCSDTSYAALVLTERMLQCCALHDEQKKSAGTGVSYLYILEERKEVKIEFNNVDQSISTLTDIIKRCRKSI